MRRIARKVTNLVTFYCMVCNEEKEQPLDSIDFLYNDTHYRGFPVCKGCKDVVPEKELNWLTKRLAKKRAMPPPKIGIERFL